MILMNPNLMRYELSYLIIQYTNKLLIEYDQLRAGSTIKNCTTKAKAKKPEKDIVQNPEKAHALNLLRMRRHATEAELSAAESQTEQNRI